MLAFLLLLAAVPASAYWYDDGENREARIAGWVLGMLAGTALISFAIYYVMRRQRRAVLIGYQDYRPPPPPGVVGYDSPYGAQEPAPPPPAYQAHQFYPPPPTQSGK